MPKMGIGVGLIVLNERNEVLLLLRNKNGKKADSDMHLEGTYTLPSGKVKFGESFERAGVRKLKEETNLDTSVGDLEVVSLASDINEFAHFATIGFKVIKYEGDFKLKVSEEFECFGWFKLDNLPSNLCFPSKKIIDNYLNNTIYVRDLSK